MSGEELSQALRDAGCNDAAVKEFMRLYTEGQNAKAQKLLSQHRKELLDSIHAEERKISCLDYLVYEMDRSM
jgi:DNA-binding transcriptional MerR regulator